jgi:hypothetical protein
MKNHNFKQNNKIEKRQSSKKTHTHTQHTENKIYRKANSLLDLVFMRIYIYARIFLK